MALGMQLAAVVVHVIASTRLTDVFTGTRLTGNARTSISVINSANQLHLNNPLANLSHERRVINSVDKFQVNKSLANLSYGMRDRSRLNKSVANVNHGEGKSKSTLIQLAISVGRAAFSYASLRTGWDDSVYKACAWMLGAYSALLSGVVSMFLWKMHYRQNSGRSGLGETSTAESGSESGESDGEWCSPETISDAISGASSQKVAIIAPMWTADSLQEVLHQHGMDTDSWTQVQLERFASELSQSRAQLCKESGKLFRKIDLLIVLLVYEPEKLVLQEFVHSPCHGLSADEVHIKECTLNSRLRSNEGFMECAARCCQKLGTDMEGLISIQPDILGLREEKRVLRSAHPGLATVTQHYVVEARVATTDEQDLEDLGLLSKTLHVSNFTYKWEDIDHLPYVKKHLRQSRDGGGSKKVVKWMGVRHSLVPVLPWTERLVLEVLKERKMASLALPPSAMKVLVQELNDGHISLAVRENDATKLVCMTERVSVVVKSPHHTSVLVSGFSEPGVAILPHVQKWSTESCWRAAVRLCQTILQLSGPLFQMDGLLLGISDTVEEKKFWVHITREYIVRGPLISVP